MNIEELIKNGLSEGFISSHSDLLGELHNLIAVEKYSEAHTVLNNEKSIDRNGLVLIRKTFTACFLLSEKREWTSHGVWKTFRFWTNDEKINYLNRANLVIESLRLICPLVTYGFGSVLGFVRDENFIPHDDDMDLLVAFPVATLNSYEQAKIFLIRHLKSEGVNCYNENETHFTANGVDVFIGFIEDDQSISWFPSKRRRGLNIENMFPTSIKKILGVDVALPNNSENYLEITYGPDWRLPNSSWQHSWDIQEYIEFLN